ncbi:MAG: hypothetical protein MJ252_00520 [archaeon]|nr:hypothetical protein [archaeon]
MMPKTYLAKVMIMLLVAVILGVIPDQTNELIELINNQSPYSRKRYVSSKDIQHVVILGQFTLDSLKSFCEEFFHKDHGKEYKHAVIIRNEPPSKEMEMFLNEKNNANFIFYLQGDPMVEEDLLRTDILKASACIIFTNKNLDDPFSSDHQSLLLCLYVKKFCHNSYIQVNDEKRENLRVCLQINKPESCEHYFNALQIEYRKKTSDDQILIIEALKMNLLSKSCITPGIIALLSNLVVSSSSSADANDLEWIRDYSDGRGHEIYKINFEKGGEFIQMSFREISMELYEKYQAIPIAIEIKYEKGTIVKLNPQNPDSIIDIIQGTVMNATATNTLVDTDKEYSRANSIIGNDLGISSMMLLKNKFPSVSIYVLCQEEDIVQEIHERDLHYKERNEKMRNESLSSKNSEDEEQPKQVMTLKENRTFHSERRDKENKTFYSKKTEEEGNRNESNFGEMAGEEEGYKNYHINLSRDLLVSNDIIKSSIKDDENIKDHVLICGVHHEIIHFILPLRAKYLPVQMLKWIVILTPNLSTELHEALSIFPKIVVIQGSPLRPENLLKANVVHAEMAVILSSGFSKKAQSSSSDELGSGDNNNSSASGLNTDELLDAETIFIYKEIKKINTNIKILTELLITKDLEFLLTTKNLQKLYNQNDGIDPKYEETSIFASGEVYLPSVIDKITAQTYYNQNLLSILNLILVGEAIKNRYDRYIEKFFDLEGSYLYLVQNDFKNESFGDMYRKLITKHNMIPIALYRKNQAEGFYYVYTNPKKTTLIKETDLVFVLSSTEQMLVLTEKINLMKSKEVDGLIGNKSEIGGNNSTTGKKDKIEFAELPESKKGKDTTDRGNDKKETERKADTTRSTVRQKSMIQLPGTGKHSEINNLQKRLENQMNRLNTIEKNCKEMNSNIDDFVKKGIKSEIQMYIHKSMGK